jgi:hypothetical protein
MNKNRNLIKPHEIGCFEKMKKNQKEQKKVLPGAPSAHIARLWVAG